MKRLLVPLMFLLALSAGAEGQSVTTYPVEPVTIVETEDWQLFLFGLRPLKLNQEWLVVQYDEVVLCAGVVDPLPLDSVGIFFADHIFQIQDDEGAWLWGVFVWPPAEIVVSASTSAVVKHELYHYLTRTLDEKAADRCAEEGQ